VIALLLTLVLAATATAAPAPPSDLHVSGGDGWRASSRFDLRWTNPGGSAIASVHYLVRSPAGATVVGPTELTGAREAIDGVRVPATPGAYTAEVWLEDGGGAEGASAATKLRYDADRPGEARPLQPGGWLSRAELPYAIRFTHPPGEVPVSGIRGYAVSIDRLPAGSPCADAELCTDAETDLRGGAEDDTLVVDELPEGVSYVHALAVTGSQMHSAAPGNALIRVDKTDPVTRLTGAPPGWTNRAVTLEATATDTGSGMGASGDGAPFTAIRVDGGTPQVSAGSSTTTTVIADGVHTVAYYARDAAGNLNDGADVNGRTSEPPATVPLRIDRDPPAVVFAGSADPEEPELIEARVADALSGPDPSRGQIAVRRAGSGDPYTALPTVAAGETLVARWHSDEFPVGEYEFRATGYDAAGNAGTSTRRANGAPMLLPNPLKSRAILVAGLGESFGDRQASRTVGYGGGATFSGRLSATSDTPLGGRSVTVVERFDPGAALARRALDVRTGEDGRFAVRLSPGPSREVFAVFAGTGTATGTASRPLRLGVRSGVRMEASSARAKVGGRPVVFRGGVSSSPGEIPPGGASVQLEFQAAGLPWTEFRSVRTNRFGRFRYAYRFSDDDSRGIRFRFRAFVPAQGGWPYEAGSSRPLVVWGA
jgi:hypothetical protein